MTLAMLMLLLVPQQALPAMGSTAGSSKGAAPKNQFVIGAGTKFLAQNGNVFVTK